MNAGSVSDRVDRTVTRLKVALHGEAAHGCEHLAPAMFTGFVCAAESCEPWVMCVACARTHQSTHGVEANTCVGCGQIDEDYLHPLVVPLSALFLPTDGAPVFPLAVVPIALGLCWACLATRESESAR